MAADCEEIPPSSPPHQHIRHMKGTLQRRCLACPLLGWWWLVKLRDGCLVGEPWDFMTYSEMLFHSTPWCVLLIPYTLLFTRQQKWKPRPCWTLSQPSLGNRWCCTLDTTLTLTLVQFSLQSCLYAWKLQLPWVISHNCCTAVLPASNLTNQKILQW